MTEITDAIIVRMLEEAHDGPDSTRHDMEDLIAALRAKREENARLRSAAILAARSSPEDIAAVGWLLSAHYGVALTGTTWWWVFVSANGERTVDGSGPTDADALDSVRARLNLPIPGETP